MTVAKCSVINMIDIMPLMLEKGGSSMNRDG